MGPSKIINLTSLIVAVIAFAVSLFVFYYQTAMLTDSIISAILSAGLIWATYIMLRVCLLATKRNKP